MKTQSKRMKNKKDTKNRKRNKIIFRKKENRNDEEIEDTQKRINARNKKNKYKENLKPKKLKRIIILIIITLIIVLGAWIGITTNRWKNLAQDMCLNEFSIVKDTDGNIIAKLGSEKKKEKVELSRNAIKFKKRICCNRR